MKEIMIDLPSRDCIPGTSLYARVYSQNSEALTDRDIVLMIPGGPGNDYTMYDSPENSIVNAFLPAVNVIVFDPRGCGSSQPSPVEYCSLDHYIDDIEALRQYFNIPAEKFIIFAQSYGSIAAVGYAIKYADSLKKLLMISGIASSEFLAEAKQDLEDIGTPEQKAVAEKLWNGSFQSKEDLAEYCHIMGPLYSYSYVQQDGASLEIPCAIDILKYGWGHFLKNFDYRPDLHKVKCKTLILWGENEWLMNKKQVFEVHHGIPHSKLKVDEKCGHMLWLDQWDKFVSDALNFLKEK